MKRAFTLIELLVTISIIALLTVVSVIGFTNQQKRARDSRRIADLGSLGLAIENYRTIRNTYPSQGTAGGDGMPIASNLQVLVDEGLINVLPQEPKPDPGTAAPVFCTSYAYAQNWDYSGPGDTVLGYWVDPVGSTHKTRAYALYARTEQAGTSTNRHPQDASIYATATMTWCNNDSGYMILAGPKT